MKKVLKLVILFFIGFGFAQENEFPVTQVEGFPPFVPEEVQLEIIGQTEDTIRVKHVNGETDIPANPQRIFVHDMPLLDSLLSLGIQPVGTGNFFPELPLALEDKAADIPQIRELAGDNGVNMEELAALDPDLILTGYLDENLYTLYSQIAPTVSLPASSWREQTLKVATLLGVPEKAEALFADYDARLADYRTRLGEFIPEGETLTILLLFGSDMWLYTPGWKGETGDYHPAPNTSWAYRELGLPAAPEVITLGGSEQFASVSLELIPELKADHIVIFPRGYGGEEPSRGLDTYLTSPLWQTVPAVQQGNVYLLLADVQYDGYYATPYLIEEFLRILGETHGQTTQ
jgi:iron complex transport system substrate-binding protein